MKASTFDYSLRREIKTLKEDLRSEPKPTIVEHTKKPGKAPQIIRSVPRGKIINNTPPKPQTPQNFTSNSALNDLLNETAMGSTNTESGNSPVSLSQPFTTSDPLPMDTSNMPDSVADAVTRDYSGLMKAINKKKGR